MPQRKWPNEKEKCEENDKVQSNTKTHTHIIVILNWILNWKCIKAENFYEIVINWENILKIWWKKLNWKIFLLLLFFYRVHKNFNFSRKSNLHYPNPSFSPLHTSSSIHCSIIFFRRRRLIFCGVYFNLLD